MGSSSRGSDISDADGCGSQLIYPVGEHGLCKFLQEIRNDFSV